MPRPVTARTDALLRCTFWLAVAAFAVNILEPGLFESPSLEMGGSNADPTVVVHSIPAVLVAWMIVSSQLRKMGHKPLLGHARWSSTYPRRPDKA